ncbi:hypothetical protein NUU61_003007 [Penicillium alfredii]|uniref:Uncharacterized protein n=1 Tax=Penicillium alfredii TaxID=1506179 RepID=A0A9W9KGJ7_9EURO|nr:uncharacterized protein NUU61_003007 [Penicillium alfredii]KAJ5105660.1 hypothetical protein NUU61_003007 [Penicillium alfredii]
MQAPSLEVLQVFFRTIADEQGIPGGIGAPPLFHSARKCNASSPRLVAHKVQKLASHCGSTETGSGPILRMQMV